MIDQDISKHCRTIGFRRPWKMSLVMSTLFTNLDLEQLGRLVLNIVTEASLDPSGQVPQPLFEVRLEPGFEEVWAWFTGATSCSPGPAPPCAGSQRQLGAHPAPQTEGHS